MTDDDQFLLESKMGVYLEKIDALKWAWDQIESDLNQPDHLDIVRFRVFSAAIFDSLAADAREFRNLMRWATAPAA